MGNRDARYAIGAKAMWAPDAPNGDRIRRGSRGARAAPAVLDGTDVRQLPPHDEDESRVRATYGANYERLVALKRRYDPENVFRSNRNIAP